MSDLLRSLVSHLRSVPNPELHVVRGQPMYGDDAPSTQNPPNQLRARLVDQAAGMTATSVGPSEPGRLGYFLDGIERARSSFLYVGMAPIVYGYVAAVIRKRGTDRLMRKHSHDAVEALYYPFGFPGLEMLQAPGVRAVDTSVEGKEPDDHPLMLREAAKSKITNQRDRLESKLAREWFEGSDGDGWLVVDGSLPRCHSDFEEPNVIGLIKSHASQYFTGEDQKKILNLKAGERSAVFVPEGRNRPAVYSWYLRMWPNDGRDMYFGLIRIEAPATRRTVDMADELSRWVLAERVPLSLPDSRWDRMIYPIRDCEMYLRSLAPTSIMLDAALMGLG